MKNLKSFFTGVLLTILIITLITTVFAEQISKAITAVYRDIKITIDGEEIIPKDANGKIVEPFIVDGTTYLPIRAISEAIGYNVKWDDEANTVVILPATITIKGTQYSTNLTSLNLSKKNLTNVDIEPLKYMTNLTELYLYENKISDISALKGLSKLSTLELDGNPLSETQIAELQAALPNCEIVFW